MSAKSLSEDFIKPLVERVRGGEPLEKVAFGNCSTGALLKYYRKLYGERAAQKSPALQVKDKLLSTTSLTGKSPRILIYDIETLPNLGYFFDTFSDRAIPLAFVVKPKSICTIAYKWYGEPETYVLVVDTPYDDKAILEAFLPEWSKADYAVAHYSRFDKPFIAARLMANGLPSLPPVNDICTYKLAKLHFGRSLNGNKLDHLGTILGVGSKIKTSADLWVGCAQGDKESLEKMALYNKQDVDLLEQVFKAMLPYVKSKLNFNLASDKPEQLCKQCGGDHLEQRGFEYTASTVRPRFSCLDCGSWNTFPAKKAQ